MPDETVSIALTLQELEKTSAGIRKTRTGLVGIGTDAKAVGGSASAGFSGLLGVLGKVTAAIVVVRTAFRMAGRAINFVVGSISDFKTQEAVLARLKATIEAQGGAWTQWEGRIRKTTAAMQNATGIGDEVQQELLTQMISSGADAAVAFDALGAALDMMTAKGMGAAEVGRAFGKAIAGNVESIGEFLPAVKKLSAEERTWENIQKLINEQVGGTAEKLGGSAVGGLNKFTAAWGDLREAVGGEFVNTIQWEDLLALVKDLTPSLMLMAKSFGHIANVLADIAGLAASAMRSVLEFTGLSVPALPGGAFVAGSVGDARRVTTNNYITQTINLPEDAEGATGPIASAINTGLAKVASERALVAEATTNHILHRLRHDDAVARVRSSYAY